MASSEAFEFGIYMLVLAKDTSFSIFDIIIMRPVLVIFSKFYTWYLA